MWKIYELTRTNKFLNYLSWPRELLPSNPNPIQKKRRTMSRLLRRSPKESNLNNWTSASLNPLRRPKHLAKSKVPSPTLLNRPHLLHQIASFSTTAEWICQSLCLAPNPLKIYFRLPPDFSGTRLVVSSEPKTSSTIVKLVVQSLVLSLTPVKSQPLVATLRTARMARMVMVVIKFNYSRRKEWRRG